MAQTTTEARVQHLEEQLWRLRNQVEGLQQQNRQLCAEKKEFMSIFDAIDAGIYVADPETHEILYVNEKLRRARPGREVVGEKCFRVLQGYDSPCDFCTNRHILQDGARGSYIWDFQNRVNGRWYRCIDKAIGWPDGRTVRYEIAIDIHSRKMAELALQESERKYSVLVESAKDGVLIFQDGICKFANTAMEHLSGYAVDEIVGKPFVDLVAAPYRDSVARGVDAILRGDDERRLYESRLACKDGQEKNIEVSRAAITFRGRAAAMSVVRDITQRKAAEEALRVSEERYRLLEEYLNQNIPLHIGATDSTYRFMVWNRYSETMLGYSAEEAIGRLTPEDIHEYEWEAQRVVRETEDNGIFDGEVNFLHKSGAPVPVHLVVVPKRDGLGSLVGLYGYAEDISVRKLAENALRESEKRFRDLVEFSMTGIFIVQDGQVVYCNPEQNRLFGEVDLPCEVETYYTNVVSDDLDRMRQMHSKLSDGQRVVKALDIQYETYHKDNEKNIGRWAHCMCSSIHYNGKRADLVNVMDVTRNKELENLLRLEDKMASLGRVAAGIAHEVRSPLSGINVIFHTIEELYKQQDDGDPVVVKTLDMIDRVKGASMKIESVVRRVLDFSKPATLQFRAATVSNAILGAVHLCSASMRKEGILLDIDLPRRLPVCYIDVQMLEQVIVNLITNAAESMSDSMKDKVITIRAGKKGGFSYVSVADCGKGIPDTLKDKVFDPYFTTKDAGSGIGLSICHRIIKDHGGVVDVSRSAAGGAEFVVKIPVVQD